MDAREQAARLLWRSMPPELRSSVATRALDSGQSMDPELELKRAAAGAELLSRLEIIAPAHGELLVSSCAASEGPLASSLARMGALLLEQDGLE